MPSFGITPVSGFPPVTDGGFPRFIQFRVNGVDVGGRSVENVNFTGDVEASVSSDGSTITIRVAPLVWTEFAGDRALGLADANQGLASTGNSGVQYVTVPSNAAVAFIEGDAVLLMQDGGAQIQLRSESGVELVFRSAVFNPYTAGEGAAITLVYRGNDRWLVTGDLEVV